MHGPSAPTLDATSVRYRRDIDGLRALAILPVLLFHAHVPGFAGGYVGVDIFFVISGFLITGIIAREVDEGRFSLLRFYERRFRRIMPALSLMILTVLVLAAWLYLPGDLEGVPKSALAASLFLSNIWFFTDTGYFAGGADTKPLLHCWSLAVEEQFYIAFPLAMLLVARFAPRWRRPVLALAAVASLTLAIMMQRDTSGFAFYLPPTRAWELLAGALLAVGAVPALRSRWSRETVAWSGLAAIVAAVSLYDRSTLFPGVAAVLPVYGAAALLHAAPGTRVGRMLSMLPLTGIGLISYSLYLWHWPLIVFVEYATDVQLTGGLQLAVIVLAFVAAFLSWRYVERPFRDAARVSARAIFAGTGGAIATLCAAALLLVAQGGWPARFSPAILAPMAGQGDFSPARKACHDTAMRGAPACVLGARVKPDAMLWGDSHGVELAYALAERAKTQGRALIERTTSSCPPVLNHEEADPRCGNANRETFAALRADPAIRRVYLVAFWANGRFDDPAFVARLDRTIAAIRALGRDVVLIGPVPPQPFDVPRRLAHLAMRGETPQGAGVERLAVERRTRHLADLFARWRDRGVGWIDPMAALCPTTRCAIVADGKPLYFDSHHLSMAGARLVVAKAD